MLAARRKMRRFPGRAPTRWGRVGYSIVSRVTSRTIRASLDLPAAGIDAEIRLRLRAPAGLRLRSAIVDGVESKLIDAERETVTIPAGTSGHVSIVARY